MDIYIDIITTPLRMTTILDLISLFKQKMQSHTHLHIYHNISRSTFFAPFVLHKP